MRAYMLHQLSDHMEQHIIKPDIPGSSISFFSLQQALPKTDNIPSQWDWLECPLFATSLIPLQASTWCLLFPSINQSYPQGRESEELKAESGAAKSG